MKRNMIFLLIMLGFCFMRSPNLEAWKGDTHELISECSVYNSKLGFSNLLFKLNLEKGLTCELLTSGSDTWGILQWIRHGAVKEDSGVFSFGRFNHHFHNPNTEDWDDSELTDFNTGGENLSLILWAQDSVTQEDDSYWEGDNSWETIRNHYHNALINGSESERNQLFAMLFKGLGHQIHLIQDSSVPDHVRNHSHPWGESIETWAEENENDVISLLQSSYLRPYLNLNTHVEDGLVPITQLVDTNVYDGTNPSASYTIGLSEYANANFFTEGTIFSREGDGFRVPEVHQFPYPRLSSTNFNQCMNVQAEPIEVTLEDGRKVFQHYISKGGDGAIIEHFVAVPLSVGLIWEWRHLFSEEKMKVLVRDGLLLDRNCYKEYAGKLIPRAVAYSAELLDYFFRGDIEISVPPDGIFAFADDPGKGFEKITIHARNNMDGNEEMTDGELTLVVRYRTCDGDPYEGAIPPKPDEDQSFIVKEYGGNGHSIPRDKPLKLEFDLSDTPIPLEAADVNISLVFRGTIGEERDVAVGLGFLDISEPTPIDFVNSTYWIGMNNEIYDVSDPNSNSFQTVFNMADFNGNGKIDCNLGEPNVYPVNLLPKYINFNGTAASGDNHFYSFDDGKEIPPNEHLRVFVLAERNKQMKYSLALDTQSTNSTTQCEVIYDSRVQHDDTRINCLVYNSATEKYVHNYSEMTQFNGAYRYLWRDYGLTHYPWRTYKFRNGENSTTAGGSDIWQLPVFRLSGSISGPILTLTVTKSDGSKWISSGDIFAKVGSYEPYAVDRYHGRVEVGEESVVFQFNLADPNYIGGYPKEFYVRYEADGGGYAWVGPLWIEESQ